MRSIGILISVLALFIVLQPQAFAAETPGGPELYIPEATAEFQAVHEGAHVQHTFVAQNKGIAALTILEVKTD